MFRNIYIRSFSTPLWMALSATFFGVICCIYAVSCVRRLYNDSGRARNLIDSEKIPNIPDEPVMWLISSISLQGWHKWSGTPSLQIIRITILVMSLVCYSVFSGSIYSTLSNQQGPILDYLGLINSNLNLVITSIGASYIVNTLKDAYVMRGFLENDTNDDNIVSSLDGYEIIRNSTTALLTVKPLWYQDLLVHNNSNHINSKEICRPFAEFVLNFGMPSYSGMFMPKNSSLREYFNHQFVGLFETGVRHRYVHFYNAVNAPRCLPPEKQPEAFGNSDVYLLYMILAAASVASPAILVKENILFYSTKKLHNYRISNKGTCGLLSEK